jgi:hypothetical protein
MSRYWMKVAVLMALLGLFAAACSSSSKTSTPATSPSTTATSATPASGTTAASIPTATTISQPVTYGYYDGHVDWMLSTDVSTKAEAASSHINFSAALLFQPASKNPSLYIISGPAAPNQPMVFGSEPGKDDYSPLWQEITVKWKAGVKPVLLLKDDQIKALATKGELTANPTPVVLNCPIVKVTASTKIPTATTVEQPVTYGYYDGHVDTMLSTDVSSKAEAASNHINYSAALLTEPAGRNPALYTISGRAAPGQPMVFGSEPGKDDYSPLWQEITVKWKAGVKPILLMKDDQIKALATKGDLTATPTPVVLNCPIVKVTK